MSKIDSVRCYLRSTFTTSAAQIDSRPQPEMLNNSSFNNLNGGNFYNTVGDAHIYNSTNSSANQLAHLHRFIATSALHNSNERFPQPKCHPSTRERILQRILNWAEKDSAERILWLSGSAGTGKSAIAQTVAELCENERLAAAFFFFRSSPERNTSTPLIATLAYQITLSIPGAKEFITKSIEDDPALFSKDINTQLFHLIVRPLTLAAREWDSMRQYLIIIDGLDECIDEKQQSNILSAISNTLTTRELPLRFLIASRPEYRIRSRFEQADLQTATVRIVLDMDSTATQDIATYLEKEFSRIREEHRIPDTPWPPGGVIQSLAERASGQFIYASTIVKFLDDRHFQPQKRLDLIFGTLPQGTVSPFAEIDLLYTQILDAVSNVEETLFILRTILFIAQHNIEGGSTDLVYLDELFQHNAGGVEHLLMDLHSVLNVQSSSLVFIHHQSFLDFLTDEARSGKYFIDKEVVLAEFSGLLWATIPRWLSQFEYLDSDDLEAPTMNTPLYSAINSLPKLSLPEGRHASLGVLPALNAIADLAEEKHFDIQLALAKLSRPGLWRDFYPVILFWLSHETLDKQHPVLWDKYISLYDKAMLRFLKNVEFFDPIHSIHFFLFQNIQDYKFRDEVICLGVYSHFKIFHDFFLDPNRSGKYYLTPQACADIVVLMVQYFPRTRKVLGEPFYEDGRAGKNSMAQFLGPVTERLEVMRIDIHLSRASPCADILVDLIRSHNPGTFLSGCCKYNATVARYLLDNSQMCEQSIKLEEDKGIRSFLTQNFNGYSSRRRAVSVFAQISHGIIDNILVA